MSTLPVITERLPLRPGKFTSPLRTLPQFIEESQPLTRKQKLAVEALVSGEAKTQKEAALLAGYSASTADAACRSVFSKPAVKKEYLRRRREVFNGIELSSQDIIDELRRLAEANPYDYVEITEDGKNFSFKLKDLTREQFGLIKELSYDALGRPKLTLHDRRVCYMDLAKLKGIGVEDQHIVNGNKETPLTIQALDALIQQSTTVTINNQINVSHKEAEKFLPVRPVIEQTV